VPSPRRVYRLARLALHLAAGTLLAALLLGARQRRSRPRMNRLLTWWHRGVCRILGVALTVRGRPSAAPALLACNHVSWLDIPVLASVVPGRFLAKAEVREWPLVGWLAARAGTLFLRRGDRAAARSALLEMVWALRRGDHVILFPEGTTTDGAGVRRFRDRLFEAAILAGAPVQPVALRFRDGDRTHPLVPFLGDHALVPHLARLVAAPRIDVEVTFAEAFSARGLSREALAARCEAFVRAAVNGGTGPCDTAGDGHAGGPQPGVRPDVPRPPHGTRTSGRSAGVASGLR
jgi:1-acyl-sn-glycerol-3-phosphate acyltransferase